MYVWTNYNSVDILKHLFKNWKYNLISTLQTLQSKNSCGWSRRSEKTCVSVNPRPLFFFLIYGCATSSYLRPLLPVRLAVGSSLLCEEMQLSCHISPSRSNTRTDTHTHARVQEAILILYSFSILSMRLPIIPLTPTHRCGARDCIDTDFVAVIVVVHYLQTEQNSFSWILWYRFLLTPHTHNCSQMEIQL